MNIKMSPVLLSMVPLDSIFSGEFFLRVPGPENRAVTSGLTHQKFVPEGHILPSDSHIHHQGHLPLQRVDGSGGAFK